MTHPSIESPGTAALAVGSPGGGGWKDPVQRVRRSTHRTTDTFLAVRPSDLSAGFPEQIRSAYRNLRKSIRDAEGDRDEFLAEKVFLSDIRSQLPACRAARDEFFRSGGIPEDRRPAVTFLQQAPARPGQLCEIRIRAIGPPEGTRQTAGEIRGIPPAGTGKMIEWNGLKYLQLAGQFGGSPGDGMDPERQAVEMFRHAADRLDREGMSFRDVVRTWIYLPEIDADYDSFNRGRNEFFRREEIHPPPASTGIQGVPFPPDRACSLDLLAIRGREHPRTARMHSPTMNEAPVYGAAFSRGTSVELGDRTILMVSGTASIDNRGRVVHPGDIAGQTNRMLLNIEELLAAHGGSLDHLVSATTYLKRKEDLEAVREVCRAWKFPEQVPHTFCRADVCRPEWLCEMEVIAILD